MSTATLTDTAQALMDSMTPKFAVSYLRVSTRGQAERGGGHDEGFSIPAQREANKKKALSMGAIVGKEFVDRGASAKSADRPQLQAMLEYVKENADRVDYVIVHKVDRLARNRDDDSDIMRALRESGVQLVSASESIDDTPAGMLLHGIMSSIAEFYSQNLATEVKKGLGEKVKGGGTVGRAPLGYINIRRFDDKGREERTVELDPERAPLVKMAFEEYATGNWSLTSLAEYMSSLGLNTRATPKIPSKPVTKCTIEKMLKNPYYAGVIRYNGAEYDGSHEALIDLDTFNQVQAMIESHHNGERTREHPHFMKGLLYCRKCGSKMIITYARSKSGNIYPYFICAGRHRTKSKDQKCDLRAILIEEVEYQIEQLFDRITITASERLLLEAEIQRYISKEAEKFKVELDNLRREKEKLEHRQEKLLEAHFNDAIPLSLMKREQQSISKQLAAIEHEIKIRNTTFDEIKANLSLAFDLIEDCGRTYRMANDNIKRLMIQAVFERIWIDEGGKVSSDFNGVYKNIAEPLENDLAHQVKKSASATADADLSDKLLKAYSNFFGQCLNNDFLELQVQMDRKAACGCKSRVMGANEGAWVQSKRFVFFGGDVASKTYCSLERFRNALVSLFQKRQLAVNPKQVFIDRLRERVFTKIAVSKPKLNGTIILGNAVLHKEIIDESLEVNKQVKKFLVADKSTCNGVVLPGVVPANTFKRQIPTVAEFFVSALRLVDAPRVFRENHHAANCISPVQIILYKGTVIRHGLFYLIKHMSILLVAEADDDGIAAEAKILPCQVIWPRTALKVHLLPARQFSAPDGLMI